MSTETGNSIDEKKGREAAEEASALDKLTDRVRGVDFVTIVVHMHATLYFPARENLTPRITRC